ncbi:MAG TPA: Fic family protein [Planctomycetota bacterium]|nr:Fic family protein [Planctomycetota bacterium]
MKNYERSHPWLTFSANLSQAHLDLWVLLGECQSKIEHVAGIPLRPEIAKHLQTLYLAKGVRATTAIEGNTLTEEQVLAHLEDKLELPPSREYLRQEVDNIIKACDTIRRDALSDEPALCSRERVKAFNRSVLDGLPLNDDVVPGEVSTFSVTVGRYRAAPREDCDYLLGRLCEWLNGPDFALQGELIIGMAILKAILAHLYIAWIHPFGDGNGRTARLVEFDILLKAGVPAPAAHLLSNHYNLTREEYYRQLDHASRSGGDTSKFITYAVQGLRDGLREQVNLIREQQRDVAWRSYVYEVFRDERTVVAKRRRDLVLDLSRKTQPVDRASLSRVSARVDTIYSHVSEKTLARDLQVLREMHLVEEVALRNRFNGSPAAGYIANKSLIDAFLPARRLVKEEQ